MQYPVPQFTEVEDKIIGPLTIKQFGILFGAGVIIFLAYTVSKSVMVTIVFSLLIGFPAIFVAFFKVNGRPLYKTFSIFYNFFTAPRVLVFHKEGMDISRSSKMVDANLEPVKKAPVLSRESTKTRLQEVNSILQKQREEEEDILKN
jgi:hypothetical protein